MTKSPATHIVQKQGFTSISRWIQKGTANVLQPESNHPEFHHRRPPYLIAHEAITIGILTTLFLLASITAEFTARTNSLSLYLAIPFVTFLSLHLLCAAAAQLANIAKPLIHAHRDIVQGVAILSLFSGYAVLRVVQPIADWFTPIAWVWLAILGVDLIGRVIEKIASKRPTN